MYRYWSFWEYSVFTFPTSLTIELAETIFLSTILLSIYRKLTDSKPLSPKYRFKSANSLVSIFTFGGIDIQYFNIIIQVLMLADFTPEKHC
jgi:hypothetical protein